MVHTGRCCTDLVNERRHLARIRCIKECVAQLKKSRALPSALAFCPAQVEYRSEKNFKLVLRDKPSVASGTVRCEISCGPGHVIILSGEEFTNNDGLWARFISARLGEDEIKLQEIVNTTKEKWVLIFSPSPSATSSNCLVPVLNKLIHKREDDKDEACDDNLFPKSQHNILNNWLDIVEHEYSLRLHRDCVPGPVDNDAVSRLLVNPPSWNLERDEDLALFLSRNISGVSTFSSYGSIRQYVKSIEVSSHCNSDYEENLTNNDPSTYWESDGSHGRHWIRLHMKPGVIVKKLWISVSDADSNYMPELVHVLGGLHANSTKKLNEVHIDQSIVGTVDVLILSEQAEHFPVIDICIKECREHGIDTRIHGIKMKSVKDCDIGINRDLFNKSNLIRYPLLDGYDADLLYKRAVMLERLIKLLDSVLVYIVPSWEHSSGALNILQDLRQLLPLSYRRLQLVDHYLGKTELTGGNIPKVYINRHQALEHRANPSADPDYKKSVFSQLYEGLKQRDNSEPPLHYRWGIRHEQWWECKFISEGVIDQGGGFRDSLSDLSEELCPSGALPPPVPFFISSPNQRNEDSSTNRDMYVINPSCTEFNKYHWLGQLMGACLRGKEFLILSLPECFWKQLIGQKISWQKDFPAVDEYLVRSLEQLLAMDEQTYKTYYADRPLTWITELSDGTVVPLKPDGDLQEVVHADIPDYVKLVKKTRLSESNKQIQAIREGLLKVVPQAVLDLLTCQEVEKRICGDPEITVAAMKKHVQFGDGEADVRIKYFWTAVENFSNDDRSRLLRFVTGRRRLPINMHIFWSDASQDSLPTSSTCGNSLFLPSYSSAKVMEEKLRYAMYNCVSIDTDTSPLDDF